MATMFPQLSEIQISEIESSGEAKVYKALRDQLPDTFDVHYSVGWIMRREEDEARDGEADFLICRPDKGFVVVEVKGGGISFDGRSGDWYSIDRYDKKHAIKDPIKQSLNAKYSILNKLKEHPRFKVTGLNRVQCGHSVFFPDLAEAQRIEKPDLPSEIVGNYEDLSSIDQWVERLFQYWEGESSRNSALGQAGVELVREVFARSFEARPLLSLTLAEEEAKRFELTQEQSRLLDILRSRRRVIVSGGAGTGKTVLALEKAKRLAGEGFSTLLTCYNRQLADQLSIVCQGIENLDVSSFHQLCMARIKRADKISGRDLLKESKATYPRADLWNVQYPAALGYSVDVIEESYDAIVCDEGQDFGDDYWLPLELLLTDYDTSPFYIFFDDNQDIYGRSSNFPIKDEPFPLTVNCRNTAQIHALAYRYYGGAPVDPPDITGQEVITLTGSNISNQGKKIHAKIVDLISNEGLAPHDIVVLITDAYAKSDYYEALRHLPLPKGSTWLEEGIPEPGRVLIDTVSRFKGLEAAVLFLWGLDGLDPEKKPETMYVGLSRAKSLLFLVGQETTCEKILLEP